MRAFHNPVRTLLIAGFAAILFNASAPANALGVELAAPVITGARAYSAADLTDVFAADIGAPVTPELLTELCERIRERYRADGYVPPHVMAVQDENLLTPFPRIHVFEAQIGAIALRGDPGPYQDVIAELVAPLQAGAVLHTRDTQRVLQALRALPGVSLKAAFERSSADLSRYTLVLTVQYDAIEAMLSAHNRGVEKFGEEMLGARVTLNGLLQQREAITLSATASTHFDRYQYGSVRVARAFGGLDAALFASISSAEPDQDEPYRGQRVKLNLQSADLLDGAWSARPLLALTAREYEWRNGDGAAADETATRAVEVGVEWERDAGDARTRLLTSYIRGLDALGAATTDDASELAFNIALAALEHRRPLAPQWRIRAQLESQWSDADLPAGERFTFGGAAFGRAFDPATLIGDSGAAASVQIETFRSWRGAWLNYGRLFAQADYATAWDRGASTSESAASATLGVMVRVSSVLSTLELSQPIEKPQRAENDSARVFLSVQAPF